MNLRSVVLYELVPGHLPRFVNSQSSDDPVAHEAENLGKELIPGVDIIEQIFLQLDQTRFYRTPGWT